MSIEKINIIAGLVLELTEKEIDAAFALAESQIKYENESDPANEMLVQDVGRVNKDVITRIQSLKKVIEENNKNEPARENQADKLPRRKYKGDRRGTSSSK